MNNSHVIHQIVNNVKFIHKHVMMFTSEFVGKVWINEDTLLTLCI